MKYVKLIARVVRHRYFVLTICLLAAINIFFDLLRLDLVSLSVDLFILSVFLPTYLVQRKRHIRRLRGL